MVVVGKADLVGTDQVEAVPVGTDTVAAVAEAPADTAD